MKFLQLLCLLNFPVIYSKMYQIDNAIGYDNALEDHHQRLTCHVHCHGITGNMLRDYHRTEPFLQNIKFPTEKDIETFNNLINCGFIAVSSAGLIYYGPALGFGSALGFGKAGIVKDSIMSYLQSLIGNVPKGSWFSSAQSFVYRSGGASMFSEYARKGVYTAATGLSCMALLSDFLENLTIEYLGDEKPFPT